MLRKNQSKSEKEDLPQRHKKPLPEPDPNLKQTIAKRIAPKDKDGGKIIHKDSGKIKRHK
jgi:hypothetical protein